jgi:hypothetical protein
MVAMLVGHWPSSSGTYSYRAVRIGNAVAQRWLVAAGGDRASYIASRLKRDTAATGPE